MNLTLMPSIASRSWKRTVYVIYDAVAICAALFIATALRMNGQIPPDMAWAMMCSIPIFLCAGLAVFHYCRIYERVWRLGSLGDLTSLIEAATLSIAVPALALVSAGARWMPSSVPIIQWFVLVALLAAGRLWRRILSERLRAIRMVNAGSSLSFRPTPMRRALLVGLPEKVEMVLRHLETSPDSNYVAVGIIDLSNQVVALRLRGVPVLGSEDALEHVVAQLAARHARPDCLIIAEGGDGIGGTDRLKLVTSAQSLGLSVLKTTPTAIGAALDLEVINLADLLGRPQTMLDQAVVARAVTGARIMVTGAGGTIGRELVRQVAALNPAEIILLDAGEFNLYSVDLELQENFPNVARTPVLVSIRQREQVMEAFRKHRPDIVLHAAALKHVPLVELNVCAGVQTNVLGTRNVADAARHYGARAMVQVSTDKAVNPVGVMGASKRLGELYCQALDLEGAGQADAPRFMTVRFGNVLGSSGSLIPLFQRQLRQRAPLTVTHPDMTRYFMTVHEAVQLVLHSMALALESEVERGRIVVLDMGEPVKIIDIARRMIRLLGLEPDRDIPIKIVGLRPGEKLYEELFNDREERLRSAIPGVFEAEPKAVPLSVLSDRFEALAEAIATNDEAELKSIMFTMLEMTPEPAHREQGQPVVKARASKPVFAAAALAASAS